MSAAVSHPHPELAKAARPLAIAVVVYVDARGIAHMPDATMRLTRCRRAELLLLRRAGLRPTDRMCPRCEKGDLR